MANFNKWVVSQVIGDKLKESFISWLRERFGDDEYLNQDDYDSLYEEFLNEWTEGNRKSIFKALLGRK